VNGPECDEATVLDSRRLAGCLDGLVLGELDGRIGQRIGSWTVVVFVAVGCIPKPQERSRFSKIREKANNSGAQKQAEFAKTAVQAWAQADGF
jgi:hypothetical protein